MRTHLYPVLCLLLAAWFATSVAPLGRNLCVQLSGQAKLGFGCACADCAVAETDSGRTAVNSCCRHEQSDSLLRAKCCTCQRLVATANPVLFRFAKQVDLVSYAPRTGAVHLLLAFQPAKAAKRQASINLTSAYLRSTVLRL